MSISNAFQWDYERNPWDNSQAAVTFSVGVFQWVPKASGNGHKKSKSIRIKGFVAESERVYQKAKELIDKLNQEGVMADNPPPWLQKQYSLPEPPAPVTEGAINEVTRNRRSSHKKALLAEFAPEFKQAGFKKKAATWHRMNKDTIEVFNVQCSQWSETYFFNVGIYLRALGSRETPLEYECHIRDRIPNMECHGRGVWDRCSKRHRFDPPSLSSFEWLDLDPETRICELKKLIVPLALDWLGTLRELDDISREILSGRERIHMPKDAYQLLGLEPPPSRYSDTNPDDREPPPPAAD